MLTVLFIAVLLVAWIILDIYLGKKAHEASLSPYEESPVRKSDAQFFSKGDKLFDHMFQHIDKAQDHIHMNFYIFRDDSIGTKMLNNLKEKARQGVTVRLLVDWVGNKISRKELRELKKAGIMFAKSQPPKFPYLFYSLNERNHRKVTIIDGKLGYIGGYNVGDEYLGRDPKMGYWRDYHLFLMGEGVADLQRQFITDWEAASGESLEDNPAYFPKLIPGSLDVKIVPTDGAHVKDKMLSLMAEANESIFIGTPYFIPGKEMEDALIERAKKGINVQILIPKCPDHPLVKDAAYPYIRRLIEAGLDVRQFKKGFYHSKVVIIDEKIVDIGTANFDKRSFHLNLEINCIVADHKWCDDVKEEIQQDFYNSSERITKKNIEKRSILDRIKEGFATVISPLL
ncbi:MAG: cardiolipin synthase [Bacillus sp. (in: Bacteria)]|nr:cardiolipin synthase [Bacillus sp. (in: firmicutes)]